MEGKAKTDPDAIAERSKEAARAAMSGCCPLAYEKMSAVLQEALDAAPLMDERYPQALRILVSDLLKAQEQDDLYRIADILPRMEFTSLYATFGASSLITTAAFALIFLLPHFLRKRWQHS